MSPSELFALEDPIYPLYGNNSMEDTAVSMAIQNHGLVPSNCKYPKSPAATTSKEFSESTGSEAATNTTIIGDFSYTNLTFF